VSSRWLRGVTFDLRTGSVAEHKLLGAYGSCEHQSLPSLRRAWVPMRTAWHVFARAARPKQLVFLTRTAVLG
jgi:hypothetical protein